jgi:CubicO group peptidase (beta-lactamase class C family)
LLPIRTATELTRTLEQIRVDCDLPSLSVNVRARSAEVFHLTHGAARRSPLRHVHDDQPYDLASLTKALATSPVVASLIESGVLQPTTRVADHVPNVDPAITVQHLLDHTSGLPKWNAFYRHVGDRWGLASTRAEILAAAAATAVSQPPGTAHAYTDIGFLVLLALIERVTGRPFHRIVEERVFEPAGAADLRWGWPSAAATERCPVREVVVEGTVHDLNCAALGGVSTHAGLFGTARAVSDLADKLMQAVLEPSKHPNLPGKTLGAWWGRRSVGSHTGGWDTVTRDAYTSTGRWLPDDSVGHLGYTGTSVWIVPSRQTVITVLTNRIHEVDDLSGIRTARPLIHDAVAHALGWDSTPVQLG